MFLSFPTLLLEIPSAIPITVLICLDMTSKALVVMIAKLLSGSHGDK